MKTKQLTFLLALIFLLASSVNCYAGEISGSGEIAHRSLEKYSLPILRSFDVSRLKRFGFYTPDKATTPTTTLTRKGKNINGYLVHVSGFDQKESEPNIMLGMVFIRGSMKMQLPSMGIDMSELEAELPITSEIILMHFGKSLVSDGWKLLTFNGSIEDQNSEISSVMPPKLEAYIKSKFPSLEFSSFYLNSSMSVADNSKDEPLVIDPEVMEMTKNWRGGQETEIKSEYYENGKLKSEINYKNEQRDGQDTTWYESGKKKSETQYKNGQKDGLDATWYDSGKKKSEIQYKNGQKDGLSTSWNEYGEKVSARHYKNGNIEGLVTLWHRNGEKKSESSWRNNEKDGLSTEWYESGEKSSETHYRNGKKNGVQKNWYLSGKKKIITHFKNGIENGRRNEWDKDGKKTYQGRFIDGVAR
jgi:antitoxin component YwqK of YwqJK toxin-antitoxin module